MIRHVPIDELHAAPQVREAFDHESLLALAATLKTVGIRQPISVRRVGNRLLIIAGERRWRAAKLAGLDTVPVLVEERELSEAEILELQLIENCAREDLNVVEKARAFDRWLKTTNGSAAALAHRVGMTGANVTKITSMLVLAADLVALVEQGRIPMSSAYELAKIADHAEQRRLAELIVSGRLTRDRLVQETRSRKQASVRPRRQAQPRERVVMRLGEGRSVAVSAPSLSVEGLIAWLTDLADRIRVAGADGRPLGEVVKALSVKGR